MNDQTRVSASIEQVSCNLDGDVVILNLKNSTYYELNPVAARVWDLLQTPIPIGDVRQVLVNEYDVTEERVRRELAQLLTELKQHGLLVVVEESNATGSTLQTG
jgi:hypothetical protein